MADFWLTGRYTFCHRLPDYVDITANSAEKLVAAAFCGSYFNMAIMAQNAILACKRIEQE
jgi:hypothetical protein